ncbi:glycosyltransferase family 2 protein [Nocardioides massiliensis]|uniref:Glycosyltransferase involved in cell wall biosynthesis n=1 Tax=Nocardioides massiliensis TaxID=1325935 RepID=A0ABT9NMI8_9ACTN|nr:glycosyltransferase family A protein [Nocardioides massiliensis]MDP9821638.1 glycosyltransferase involved in cell wall biosynthesis [Nocardioides massiliensis]
MAEGREVQSEAALSDPGSDPGSVPGSDPQVTVVVAVYNTMPYLVECLDSLVEQSLHRARPGSVEVIAVDDGSTDGSGGVLDEYAARHPELLTVVHQENSGGPARPNNVALDRARGRWVYFVGADDRLGTEALERLVAHGDRTDADVVIGAQVGVGRFVPNALFGHDHESIDPFGRHLRWTLANSKLFRRSHIEDLDLRYREDMRIGSDQPFTLRACLTGKVAVLGSYDCYYVIRREDDSNITYGVDHRRRVADTERLIEAIAELVPAEGRAHFLVRHFTWELNRLLPPTLADLPAEDRDELLTAVRRIADRWYTPELDRKLGVAARVRLRLAFAGEVEALAQLRDALDGEDEPPVLLTEGRALSALPVLRTPAAERAGLGDKDFALGAKALNRRVQTQTVVHRWQCEPGGLRAEVELPLDPASTDLPQVWVGSAGEHDTAPQGSLVREGTAYVLEVAPPASGPSLQERMARGARVYVGGTIAVRDGQRRRWAAPLTALSVADAPRGILTRLKQRVTGRRDEG